ncbi:MAG: ArsR/SmtB family transcription factor [Actinomycetota bacterium]
MSFNPMVERSAETLDRTYAALAHRIRREMLERLRAGPTRVTSLAGPFDVSLAAPHIRMLESAGLVTRSVLGRDHLLSLEQPRPRRGTRLDRSFWGSRLDALEAHLETRR